MNNEMNNLNMTMTAMKESRGEGNYSALKTLTNVYNSMLNKFVNLEYNDLSEYSIGEKLETNLYEVKKIESHLSEVSYPNSIDNGNYKDSHKIQYIIEELDKVILKLEILVEKYRRMRDVNNIMKSDVGILKVADNSEKFKNTSNKTECLIFSRENLDNTTWNKIVDGIGDSEVDRVDFGIKVIEILNEYLSKVEVVTNLKIYKGDELYVEVSDYSPYTNELYMSKNLRNALKSGRSLTYEQNKELKYFKVNKLLYI